MVTTTEVIEDLSVAEALRSEWSDLADASGARAPGYPWWCLSWWRTLGHGRLHIVVVREDRQLIGLAPLHRRPLGPAGVNRFLGHASGSVSRVLAAPGREAEVGRAVWPAVLDRPGQLLQLLQYELRPGDPLECLSGASTHVPAEACPTIDPSHSSDPETGEKLARILRRADRALARDGKSFQLTVAVTRAEVTAALGPLAVLVRAAEEAHPRGNLMAGSEGSFTAELMGEAADAGRLRLYLGWIDGELVAFHAGFLGCRSVALWGHRTHPGARPFSPGHLNIRAVLTRAREEGIEEVDLFPGNDAYKQLWADSAYSTTDVLAAGSRLGLRVAQAALNAAESRRRSGS